MDNYKIIFPTGYEYTNMANDYLDANIVFKSGDVYIGTFVTIEYIKSYIERGHICFRMDDMIIVNDLKKETISAVIKNLITEKKITLACSKIGTCL